MTVKLTCGDHRTLGYYYSVSGPKKDTILACRGCGEPEALHETVEETAERNRVTASANKFFAMQAASNAARAELGLD